MVTFHVAQLMEVYFLKCKVFLRVYRTDLSDQFRKIIIRYKRIYYNLNVMRQYACLVINQVTVDDHAALYNCTPVGRVSESMMAPT